MEPFPFGKYIIVEKIGSGGMAEVYRAISVGPDGFEKEVAIKRIHHHLLKNNEFLSMFITEAKVSALLDHNNIVTIYELGYFNNEYYICMEYVWGKDLAEFMKRTVKKGLFNHDIGMYILSEVCKGLDYAHRKTDLNGNPLNIVHRDISPQNILISFEGEIKITDFGIAKVALRTKDTALGILKGKIDYMSPEQLSFKSVDHRSDIYSAGVLLYELITGRKPYEHLNDTELIEAIRKGFPEKLLNDLEEKHGEIGRIIRKATARDIRDRYENCKDFYDDIRRYLLCKGNDYQRKLSDLMRNIFPDESKVKKIDTDVRRMIEPTKILNVKERKIAWLKSKMARITGSFFIALLIMILIVYVLLPKGEKKEVASLKIISNPSDVDVFLNDKLISRKTPLIIDNLSITDQHEIVLRKQGYSEEKRKLALSPGETKELRFDLKVANLGEDIKKIEEKTPRLLVKKRNIKEKGEIYGILKISTNPEDAMVFINGKYKGQSPLEIGSIISGENYEVMIKKDGYREWRKTVTAGNNKILNLQIKLEPSFGLLSINVIPWAEVIIDGNRYGETPLLNIKLQTGNRKIKLINKNLNIEREMEVKIHEGEHVKKVVDLFEKWR